MIKEGCLIWMGVGEPATTESKVNIFTHKAICSTGILSYKSVSFNIYVIYTKGIDKKLSIDFFRTLVSGNFTIPDSDIDPCFWNLIANNEAAFSSETNYYNPLCSIFSFITNTYRGPLVISGFNIKHFCLDSLTRKETSALLELGGLTMQS